MKKNNKTQITVTLLFFLGLLSCSFPQKSNNSMSQSAIIVFDSLKNYFEKGDIIVINDWVLLQPKDFFDSISINKNLIRGTKLNQYSVLLYFGDTEKNVYEITVPNMDSLPKGVFIDSKIYKYLDTNIPFLAGSIPISSNFLYYFQNKKIKNVALINSEGAVKIWGVNAGKDGVLNIEIDKNIEAQNIYRPYNPNSIGRNIACIDSAEYFSNKTNFTTINEPSNITKVNGIIKVQIENNKPFVFEDDTISDNYTEYFIKGEDKRKNWFLVEEQGDNIDTYYIINKKYNKIDTLVGNPMIFGDRLICLEGNYTGGTDYIQIYDIRNDTLALVKEFSLRQFLLTEEIYIKMDFLYVKDVNNKYYKVKL